MNTVARLTPDELLTTTRAVRRRLDLTRPVPLELITECLAIAQQAPCEGNMQQWHFVVVTDAAKRAALADCWRQGWEVYKTLPISAVNVRFPDSERNARQARVVASTEYLAAHLHEVPVHVVPCMGFRTDGQPTVVQSAIWVDCSGSLEPHAGRSRAWPWDELHVAPPPRSSGWRYYTGDTFKPVKRNPMETIVHLDTW